MLPLTLTGSSTAASRFEAAITPTAPRPAQRNMERRLTKCCCFMRISLNRERRDTDLCEDSSDILYVRATFFDVAVHFNGPTTWCRRADAGSTPINWGGGKWSDKPGVREKTMSVVPRLPPGVARG